jgi:hypothetical protein
MANNCYNRIEIVNLTDEAMQKIIDWAGTYEKFNYVNDWVNSLISKENQLTPNYDQGGDPYEYGTKWFDFEIDVDEQYNILVLTGDTAWSPLEGMCKAISKEFNCLVMIEFEESGCNFGGETHYINGIEDEIFNGTYREYQYYCTGLEYLESDTEWIDELEVLDETEKDWLKICTKKEEEEVKNHFKELREELLKKENHEA